MPRPILIAFIVVVIDAIGIGLIIPVLPDLIGEVTSLDPKGADVIWIGGILGGAYALMQFFFGPLVGSLSDRFGRRPVLLTSLAVLSLDYIIMGLAPSLWLLFVGRILAGIAGASYTSAYAVAADVSSAQDRAKNFGVVQGSFGLGFIAGPLLGGFIGEIDIRLPFYFAAVASAVAFLVTYFIFEESLPADKRRAFSLRESNAFAVFSKIIEHRDFRLLFLAMFLYNLGHAVLPLIWTFWSKVRFDWSPFMIGFTLFVVGIAFTIVQLFLVGKMTKRFGNLVTARLSLGVLVVALLGYAYVPTQWLVFALIPVSAFGAMAVPAIAGFLSNRVSADKQGELQGVFASLMSLSMVLGPAYANTSLSYFTGDAAPFRFAGAPYFLAALLIVASLISLRYAAAKVSDRQVSESE